MDTDPIPRLSVALDAFELARGRVEDNAHDAEASFVPLTEACWWAICIHDGLRQFGQEAYEKGVKSEGQVIRGLVHVRNLLGHQRATTVHQVQLGRTYPRVFPLAYGTELRWLPLEDLPEPDQSRQANKRTYDEALAGQEVTGTLRMASSWLHHAVDILGLRLQAIERGEVLDGSDDEESENPESA